MNRIALPILVAMLLNLPAGAAESAPVVTTAAGKIAGSAAGDIHAFKVIPYAIAHGCAAAYYPETNVLVPVGKVARGSNQPASKSLVISLEPSRSNEFSA